MDERSNNNSNKTTINERIANSTHKNRIEFHSIASTELALFRSFLLDFCLALFILARFSYFHYAFISYHKSQYCMSTHCIRSDSVANPYNTQEYEQRATAKIEPINHLFGMVGESTSRLLPKTHGCSRTRFCVDACIQTNLIDKFNCFIHHGVLCHVPNNMEPLWEREKKRRV